jgi:hypothetical protein
MNCTVTQHPAGGGNDSATQLSAVARDRAGMTGQEACTTGLLRVHT